jgi:hypothetical protein
MMWSAQWMMASMHTRCATLSVFILVHLFMLLPSFAPGLLVLGGICCDTLLAAVQPPIMQETLPAAVSVPLLSRSCDVLVTLVCVLLLLLLLLPPLLSPLPPSRCVACRRCAGTPAVCQQGEPASWRWLARYSRGPGVIVNQGKGVGRAQCVSGAVTCFRGFAANGTVNSSQHETGLSPR